MHTQPILTFAALVLLTLAGCAATSDATGAPASDVAASSTTSLEGTYWKLTGLGTQPIEPGANRPEPHLMLDAGQSRVTGSGGCNRFMGSYRLDGADLTFGGVAGTLMACMDGMEEERAFLSSLEHVTTYRIAGKRLDLLNANGATVAQFEAGSTP